ncbi:MAG: primosomal protein N' [Chloroflexi bacterium]|nr:primosomal protein N' [Chloroflexota bacterium]
MPVFVQLAVNVPSVAGVFDYALPESLAGQIGVGHLVIVPFGKQTAQGIVLRFINQPSIAETKEIIELVDPEPVLTQAQILLAESLAESTLSSLASIIALFLPPGLNQQVDTIFAIRETYIESPNIELPNIAARLVKLLKEKGPLRGRQIDRHIAKVDWRKPAQYLVKRGVLTSQSVLPPSTIRPKFIRTAQLAVTPEIATAAMSDLGSTAATRARRQKALRFLIKQPEAINVSWVYAESGCNISDLQELEERQLIILRETEIFRDPLEKIENPESGIGKLILTGEQENVRQKIELTFRQLAEGKSVKPFLLQGVTGSGKTEIYLRAAEEALRRGRQAIILVPEISLTPQTVRRFMARFPGQVGLMHSKLSEGERYDTWRRARAGQLKIIIGPRSALFAPLPNPGLIVADECHDNSYYQGEPPFYHAIHAAQIYARTCGAVLLLGTATPSVVQQSQAESGESVRLELTQRIASDPEAESVKGLDLPPIHIVDMRAELKAGNRGIFSRELTDALGKTLERGEQAILFLNRRGTATYVFCRDCGYVVKCPRCDTPMTAHVESSRLKVEGKDSFNLQPSTFKLLCHRCGYSRQMPKKCPECGGANIRAYGLGSEKVESETQALFPKARTLRWDWETTREKDAHEIILTHFASGRADVLIGTQMLAKGLDLPRVTLVGIVLADVGLHLPDPFAAERVFQVLTQVAGRAGRSSRGGQVILQTFSPEHYAVQAASKHDVNGFYQQELIQRRRLGYPPFARLARLEFRHRDSIIAEKEARALADKIQKQRETENWRQVTLIGPTPCFFSKLGGDYRWQIILRAADPASLLRGQASRWLKGWRVEVEPISLL